MQSYDSFRSLKEAVLLRMRREDVDSALHLISQAVDQIITEPICTSQVFGSATLDDLCQRIGYESFSNVVPSIIGADSGQRENSIVFIVTKLQKSGGHTRVIEDFIKARPTKQHIILSTELIGRSDAGYINKMLAAQENIIFESAPMKNFQQRLGWLQKRLLEISPKKVYLFNHHQDSVAVAAIQPDMNLDASFYHHGDHHLCLGVYLSHLQHIDFHPMGYHNCRDVLGINNTYIPLTSEDKGCRSTGLPFRPEGMLTTCTAARSNKIEIPYFVSYLELLPELLNVTGGRHIHIGRLSPWALFRIRRGLKRCGVGPDQFIYIPWVPSVWKALHQYKVDLYIASFPYGGGLTLIEAMGSGTPVALHRHIYCQILSGIDLAHPQVFSWRSPDELLDYCSTISPVDLEKASRSGRLQYEKFHTEEVLESILNSTVEERPEPNNLSGSFTIDSDEWAIWAERQLTMKRVFSRMAYRAFRRLRAWW